MLFAVLLSLMTPAATAAECGGGKCAPNASTTEAFLSWSAPTDAQAPPIDRRAPAHLRVATFALG